MFSLRYGIYLGLLQDTSGTMNDLHMLLTTVNLQLKTQQYTNKPTLGKILLSIVHQNNYYNQSYYHVGFLKASQAGFDWFVATVFLITRGSLQTTLNILQEVSCLITSAYLWPSRIHKSVRYLISLLFMKVAVVLKESER